ncbi:ABC-2 transporter permease [Terrisporobacter mayombei]|uniref:ABC-2 transporter permease n=1 Tax=Terrisporobacter mayombei TaxID=1541 RepID=A0ABY9Q5V9_9FIRM|nr:ABC-2 transporter permease [Terrisporobacter mayombei]MCC3869218.1 ABC-2 transporter permease [Terrisporobacter mayombei]WMT82644.1 hypothetical protein TEMA_31320 [Terrisporobacter mayombei]
MINLLKKDLIACFKADIKTILKLIVGILIFSFILFPIASIMIPLFISYIFILRSFYLDELNKCDYFFNSLPIEKEDIVYSKYILATIVIVTSFILTFFYSKIMNYMWGFNNFNIDSALSILSVILFLISILFPIMFKYGYRKSYVLINLIIAVIIIISMFSFMGNGVESDVTENVSTLKDNSLIIKTGVSMLLYLISMGISNKIYIKKEIAS